MDVTSGGARQTATCLTLEDAILRRKEMVGGVPRLDSWTLQQAFDATVKAAWKGSRSEINSVANAKVALNYFGPDTKLDRIGAAALDEFVSYLADDEGLADGTINRKLAALSKMFSVALARGGLLRRPALPRRRESVGRIRYLSQDEERTVCRLLAQWDKRDHHDAVVVLVDTGLRLGELLRLEDRDISRQHRMIHVWETKADQPRSVPLTERVWSILEARRVTHPGKLFPFSQHVMRAQWDRVRGVMGLAHDKQFVIHALRHTCASRLVQRGVPLKVVQEWMGHKKIDVTMRYAHLSPANLMAAVKVLETGED